MSRPSRRLIRPPSTMYRYLFYVSLLVLFAIIQVGDFCSFFKATTAESAAAALETGRKQNLTLVHIPKTGGSTIDQVTSAAGMVMGKSYALAFERHKKCKQFKRKSIWHLPPRELQGTCLEDMYQNIDTFAVIRNPFTKLVSEFYFVCTAAKDIKKLRFLRGWCDWRRMNDPEYMNEFIQNNIKAQKEDYLFAGAHYVPQYDYFYDENGKQTVTHMLRFERLADDFDDVMSLYGLNVTIGRKREKGRIKKAKLTPANFTAETIALVQESYAKDFELGGYSTDPMRL